MNNTISLFPVGDTNGAGSRIITRAAAGPGTVDSSARMIKSARFAVKNALYFVQGR